MIHGFDVYRMYLAFKQHFSNPTFDFFQYDGKVKAKETTYQQRNDYYFFETLARSLKKEEVQRYMLASFIQAEDPKKVWIGDIKRDGKARYLAQQKQMDSLSYTFGQDCDTVVDYMERNSYGFNTLFGTTHGQNSGHPPALKLYLQKKITLESLLICDMVLGFMKEWDNNLKDPLWEGISFKIKKYKPFLSIPTQQYKKVLQSKFSPGP